MIVITAGYGKAIAGLILDCCRIGYELDFRISEDSQLLSAECADYAERMMGMNVAEEKFAAAFRYFIPIMAFVAEIMVLAVFAFIPGKVQDSIAVLFLCLSWGL